MRKFILLALLALTGVASAKTLSTITLLPPVIGYYIPTNTGTLQLTPLCTYSDSTTDNCSSITLTWGSGDPVNLTVNSSGLATATGASTAAGLAPDIYAYNGAILGHSPVYITSAAPGSLSLSFPTSNTVVAGSTVLEGIYDNLGNTVGEYCNWASSNNAVGKVNYKGEVTGVAAGSVNITCSYAGLTVVAALTITAPTFVGNTYYVRPGGGTVWTSRVTSGQCDGTVNVDYPGTGTDQHCAVNNPEYCFTDESSNTAYTGIVQPGDTCMIAPKTTPYNVTMKDLTHEWVTNGGGAMYPPSGITGHPTKILGANYASCSTDQQHVGNRSAMITLGSHYTAGLAVSGRQNIDVECIDMSTGNDCNDNITGGNMDFPCPLGNTSYLLYTDDFTANLTDENSRYHGAFNALTGTPGPGTVFTGTSVEYNYLDGINANDPFSQPGSIADGFTFTSVSVAMNGCSEEQPKSLASVARDGSGHLNVTFAGGQIVNFVPTNNFVLTGAVPSDLNGSYPVSSITFNQQTLNITGGTITNTTGSGGGPIYTATFTTSTAPAFPVGTFVNLSGVSPSYLNTAGANGTGGYEVMFVSGTGFSIVASAATRPGWTPGTITSGGTASTAISLIAAASGSAETATTVGTGGHVYQQHRCTDQFDGGLANGDGIGTGTYTIGSWNIFSSNIFDNTQDGWDMLHSAITSSTVSRLQSSGNMGAPLKFGNMNSGSIQNGIFIGNAQKMAAFDPNKPPDFNQYLSDFYRASDTLPIHVRLFSNVSISNNTFWTAFGTVLDDFCTDAVGCNVLSAPLAGYYFQNNIIGGYTDANAAGFFGNLTAIYCGASCNGSTNPNANWTWLNNMSYNTRNPPSGGTGNQWSTNPLVVTPIANITTFAGEAAALNWNMNLTAPSPAIAAGVSNSFVPAQDHAGVTTTTPPVMGAFNFASSSPILVSIALTPNPFTQTVGGATTTLTCTATMSDSSTTTCASQGTVTWTSSVTSVATVSGGIVTAVGAGSTNITATVSGITSPTSADTVSATMPFTFTVNGIVILSGRVVVK